MCIRILAIYFFFRANNLHFSDVKEGESELFDINKDCP